MYYFHAIDGEEIEGACELPDDTSAIKFATELAQQLGQKLTHGSANVSVENAAGRKLCTFIVKGETLH